MPSIDFLHPPKDIEANKNWRIQVLEFARDNLEAQALIRSKCAEQTVNAFIYFCNAFGWTYDPREGGVPHKPLILWPKQIQYVEWLEWLLQRSSRGERINGYVDKPRGIGASVVTMSWVGWHYLFDNFTARVGSRKEDFIDLKGEPDCLFYKLDYLFDKLPAWMIEPQERASMIYRRKDTSGNTIVGETANPNFGRGGRKSITIFDEFGAWEWARASWESAGEATNFRLAITTPPPAGKDSHAYKLLIGQAGRVIKFEFDWRDDPRRNDAWLKEAKETKSEEEFAREVLKSFEGTTKGKVYAISLRHADVVPEMEYNPELALFVSWDFGLDSVAMIWWLKNFATNQVCMLDCYSNENKEIDYYVPFVKGNVGSGLFNYSEAELDIIARHKNWSKEATHFGDPDVKKRNLITKESVRDHLYQKHSIYVQSQPWGGREWLDLRNKTNLLFRRLTINEKWCEPVLSALRNAKFPESREGSQSQHEANLPIHDWCLVGETKIRTLNGWKEIKDIQVGEYVWGYNQDRKILDIGKVAKSGKTRLNAELVEVGLDNGRSIKCTPDHKFMLRNGEYREARALKVADSLMPFYELNDSGYIKIDLNNGSFAREHQYVFNRFNGYTESDYVIDHIDGDHFNNLPENLQKLKLNEHCYKSFKGINDHASREEIDRTDYSREFYDHSLIYKICGYCGEEYRGSHKTLYCSKECSKDAWKQRNSPEERIKRDPKYAEIRTVASKNYEQRHARFCEICCLEITRKSKRCRKCAKNHKVRYIKFLAERQDTYDIMVPELHNFVAEGVVIKNSSHFRTAVEYFADNEPESNIVKTQVQSTSVSAPVSKPPHIVEAERNERERRGIDKTLENIRTVVGGAGPDSGDKFRVI